MASQAIPVMRQRAVLYRMVMPTHICPFGLKARWLLKHKGYSVEDIWLTSRAEQDAFKAEHGVKTTPQAFIGDERVGGYDDLRRFLGLGVADPKATSYWPVVAVFGVAAAIAFAIDWLTGAPLVGIVGVGRFIATAMCLLAMLKMQDVDRFATMFLGYDLLARAYVPYAYAYPFAEFGAGALMLAGVAMWLSAPVALIIGGVGAVSVIKAVYVDGRRDGGLDGRAMIAMRRQAAALPGRLLAPPAAVQRMPAHLRPRLSSPDSRPTKTFLDNTARTIGRIVPSG